MKNNKPSFSKLPKWKQRVEIAKDVILQLKLKRFFANTGDYIQIEENYSATNDIDDVGALQADSAITNKQITCNVCAKGAIFMSHVMKTNHCTVDEANSTDEGEFIGRLKMFSHGQLDTIECAFEKKVVRDREGILGEEEEKNSLANRAIIFSKSNNSTKRLIKIMENIIKNKGEFKP